MTTYEPKTACGPPEALPEFHPQSEVPEVNSTYQTPFYHFNHHTPLHNLDIRFLPKSQNARPNQAIVYDLDNFTKLKKQAQIYILYATPTLTKRPKFLMGTMYQTLQPQSPLYMTNSTDATTPENKAVFSLSHDELTQPTTYVQDDDKHIVAILPLVNLSTTTRAIISTKMVSSGSKNGWTIRLSLTDDNSIIASGTTNVRSYVVVRKNIPDISQLHLLTTPNLTLKDKTNEEISDLLANCKKIINQQLQQQKLLLKEQAKRQIKRQAEDILW